MFSAMKILASEKVKLKMTDNILNFPRKIPQSVLGGDLVGC